MIEFLNPHRMTVEEGKQNVGSGWAKLVERAFKIAGKYGICTVKEKFGGLRIYVIECAPSEVYKELNVIENESQTVCEFCGEKGEPRNLYGWYKTMCEDCALKENGIVNNA